MDDGFSPCVCHKGCTWPTEELTDDGHCPLYEFENEEI